MAVVDYKKQAQAELDPAYQTQVTNLKNTLAQNLLNLDQSKTGINTNYDTQVGNQNLANIKGKNAFSNTMLGRGLSQSSIVGTGLGEQDQINNRIVGQINTDRTGKLNAVDAQKTMLEQNSNNDINTLTANRDSQILALARQLENDAWDKNYKMQQLAASRNNGGSNGGSNGSNGNNPVSNTDVSLGDQARAKEAVAKRLQAAGDKQGAQQALEEAAQIQSQIDGMRYNPVQVSTPVSQVAASTPKKSILQTINDFFTKGNASSPLAGYKQPWQ